MADCKTETWTLEEIRESLEKETNGNKKIVIPMFQRGKRWDSKKKECFIDSLKKKYPIGTLLFYKTVENQKEIYTLIDGLQIGSTIKEYLSNPTKFFNIVELNEESLNKLYSLIIVAGSFEAQKKKIDDIIIEYFKTLNSYDDIDSIELFGKLSNEFPILKDHLIEYNNTLKDEFNRLKKEYNDLAKGTLPAIVYTGDEGTLPEIFERINSKGVALTEYEIYAASWPRKEFKTSNSDLVEYVLKKYDILNDADYTISGYDRDEKRINKHTNAFEYVFGLSKYLQNKYASLNFYRNLKDDETNPVAFQLLNACFNNKHGDIKDVHKIITRFSNNIDVLEKTLTDVIEFVNKCIEPVLKFKANSRNNNKIYHSQYQIMSLISFTFRKKYDVDSNVLKIQDNWKESKKKLQSNIWKYYVYDIITKYWFDGGTNKIHTGNNENRYFIDLTRGQFVTAFDSYCESLANRHENKNVANPSDIDYVILNTIYLNIFSAMDQLSIDRFDVEHIATKEQMKKLNDVTKGNGLPISHLANLCYLPEFDWYQNFLNSENAQTYYWDRYKNYLETTKHFPKEVINVLENKTLFSLMSYLGNPKDSSSFSVRGLVVGDVQSGKTSNYLGLLTKAADSGYKVIFILTGTIESLRKQTQQRVEEGFIGWDSFNGVAVGVGRGDPTPKAFTSRAKDFVGTDDQNTTYKLSNYSSEPMIFVLKKNVSVLKKVFSSLRNINTTTTQPKINYPALIIDDEADNASINTNKPNNDPTKINRYIRNLLSLFTRNSYVGFTANICYRNSLKHL